jgi:hypothetical protein
MISLVSFAVSATFKVLGSRRWKLLSTKVKRCGFFRSAVTFVELRDENK